MKQRQELWDELEKQKALLHEQEQQVYRQLSKLVDAVLIQAADLQYIRKAKNQGAYVHLIYAGLNALEEYLERIENRVRKGGKGADIAEVKRQFESRWDALECVLPYCHEVSFFDFTNGINLVGSYRYGEVSVTESGWRCDWFREWRQHHNERKKEKL